MLARLITRGRMAEEKIDHDTNEPAAPEVHSSRDLARPRTLVYD
jgi:hypothetical protein